MKENISLIDASVNNMYYIGIKRLIISSYGNRLLQVRFHIWRTIYYKTKVSAILYSSLLSLPLQGGGHFGLIVPDG